MWFASIADVFFWPQFIVYLCAVYCCYVTYDLNFHFFTGTLPQKCMIQR